MSNSSYIPPCPKCNVAPRVFGEALFACIECPKCGDFVMGVGIPELNARWTQGDRSEGAVEVKKKMPRYIIHKDGVYNVFCTTVDDCLYEGGLSLEDLRAELDPPDPLYFQERLARAHHNGCSSFRHSLDCCIKANRSGPNETRLSREDFVKKYLTRRRAFERIDRE